MMTFTIDDLPSTFARILEVDDRQVREEIIACVHSVWEQASYNPHVLSNIGLDAWASHYARYCDRDELLVYLRQLRMEMLRNASIYEQYHTPVDVEEAFNDFIEGNTIQEDIYTLFVEENDPNEISDIATENAEELFRMLYGIPMTESQQLDTLDFVRDLVDQEFQNFRYYEEEPTMTANYKNNANNESRFIETAQLALADQAVLDEIKNNYYASVADDSSALTRDGMKAFAKEWVKTVLDNIPIANAREEEICFVEGWLIREILEPMAGEIKNATPEETVAEEETPVEEDVIPDTPEEPTKKPNVFITLGEKTKKAFKRAISAIRKVLTTIGNAIKNAAIKTGRKACDVAHFVYSHYFLHEAIDMIEALVIGTTIGRIAVKIMLALHIVNYSLPFFLILAGAAVIAGLLAGFVSWLNDKVLLAMSNKHLIHKYSEV